MENIKYIETLLILYIIGPIQMHVNFSITKQLA